MQTLYTARGWRTFFHVPRAVALSDDGEITLNLNSKHNLGASAVWKNERTSPGSVKVKTLDFPAFVESQIRHRTWAKHFSAKPYVLMKMDIEGSEFIVLPALIEKGLLCKGIIDMIFIEWHPQYVENGKARMNELRRRIDDTRRCSPGLPTHVSEVDDETYNKDGKPLF